MKCIMSDGCSDWHSALCSVAMFVCVFEGFDSGNGDQYFNATFQVGVPPSITGMLTAAVNMPVKTAL